MTVIKTGCSFFHHPPLPTVPLDYLEKCRIVFSLFFLQIENRLVIVVIVKDDDTTTIWTSHSGAMEDGTKEVMTEQFLNERIFGKERKRWGVREMEVMRREREKYLRDEENVKKEKIKLRVRGE